MILKLCRYRPGDVAAVAMLVAVPALVFGIPALFGHPVLPGDDLTQNYPLRVLAGQEIRSGHLPLLDPYTWSGSALLAGWNAGAAYPFTWLFAVLPGVAAWTCGLIATYVTAGAGTFWFLRSLGLRPLAGFLGAASFTLGGAMAAQDKHFGLVAGMSWVPLALLAVLQLSRSSRARRASSRPWRARLGWTALLAVAIGLLILAGEPRAIADGAVIVALYAAWHLVRLGRRAVPALVSVSGGIVLGLGLGAVQWLPGLAAISTSQRGDGSLALFSSGSLPDRWLLLTLVPNLLGGSYTLSQPSFFAGYNLTEVTSYVGILPVMAAFALLGRLRFGGWLRRLPEWTRSGAWRRLRGWLRVWGSLRRLPEWLIWHVLAVAGVALALGGNSPLGAILYRLPFYGGQRLQSRNVLLLDFALAVLLAYWVDQPFPARAPRSGWAPVSPPSAASCAVGRRFRSAAARIRVRVRVRVRVETVLALIPPLAMIVVVALGLTWGAGLLRWLGTEPDVSAAMIGRLRPWLVPYAVIGAAAIALVTFGRQLRPGLRARACAAFVVTDLTLFSVLTVVGLAPLPAAPATSATSGTSAAAAPTPTPTPVTAAVIAPVTRPVSALGYEGRFAIYDPDQLDPAELSTLEPPDVNDISPGGMPSVQGYSSIVDGDYANATGSHEATGQGQDVLSPTAIGDGTLDSLNTSILLTLPDYLTTTGAASGSGPASGPTSGPASGPTSGPVSGPAGSGRRDIGAGQRTTWYLGQSVDIARVTVPDADARQDAATGTRIGLVGSDGSTRWFPARAVTASELQISLPAAATAIAVTAQAGHAPCPFGAPSIARPGGQVLVADGQLQNSLMSPRWDAVGFDGPFAVFADRFAAGPLTVQPLTGPPLTDQPLTDQPLTGQPLTGQADAEHRSSGRPGSGRSVPKVTVRYATGAHGEVTTAAISSMAGARVVRSVAAIPGWSATWQPRDGQPVPLSVHRYGVVQAVTVPPGQGIVSWHYTPPRLFAGLALSLAALVLVVAFALFPLVRNSPSRNSLPRKRRARPTEA